MLNILVCMRTFMFLYKISLFSKGIQSVGIVQGSILTNIENTIDTNKC